jgi:hypothetical protein
VCQLEKALGEGHAKRILPVAGSVARAVGGIQRRILHRDVGRVADDGVVGLAEDAVEVGEVLRGKGMFQRGATVGIGTVEQAAILVAAEFRAVQQTVAGGEVELEVRRFGQPGFTAGLERGDQQTEARDGDGEGVEVDAVDAVQRPLHGIALVAAGIVLLPLIEQAGKAAEQEVPRAAGRVDQPDFLVAELGDGRGQRAVEDEFFDELRCLQQGKLFLRRFGKILIEVAEKARAPLRVGEVMHQRTPVSGLIFCQKPRMAIAPSPETARRNSGLCRSSNSAPMAGNAPTSR